jgi:uncharacterized membrane protein
MYSNATSASLSLRLCKLIIDCNVLACNLVHRLVSCVVRQLVTLFVFHFDLFAAINRRTNSLDRSLSFVRCFVLLFIGWFIHRLVCRMVHRLVRCVVRRLVRRMVRQLVPLFIFRIDPFAINRRIVLFVYALLPKSPCTKTSCKGKSTSGTIISLYPNTLRSCGRAPV